MAINFNHSQNKIASNRGDLVLDASNNISANANRVTNVDEPIEAADAATKQYVDDQITSVNASIEEAIGNIDFSTLLELEGVAEILAKLTPDAPDTIFDKLLTIPGAVTYRLTDFIPTNNTSRPAGVTPGGNIDVIRGLTYTTSTITQVGPGDSGTVEVVYNDVVTDTVTLDENDNSGTTGGITISNNVDYSTVSGSNAGFHYIYDVSASGPADSGWNNVLIQQGSNASRIASWYADTNSIGAPAIENLTVTPSTTSTGIVVVSGVPHYTPAQQFDISFDVKNLSGDTYPTTDTFATALSPATGSALSNVSSLTYAQAGIDTPLQRNAFVNTGKNIVLIANVRSGIGRGTATAGPGLRIDNSYATTDVRFEPGATVLYYNPTDTSPAYINEYSIPVTNVGTGSGNAYRIETLAGDTPARTMPVVPWTETTVMDVYDAACVGGVITADNTDYSTGYLPVGPDLSGRDDTQVFEVAFTRTTVSKFSIKHTGTVSACYVKLPGSAIDATSTVNGYIDPSVPYEGAGVPGDNTAAGGNSSLGCGLASLFPAGQTVSNYTTNVTFGTESSTNATDGTIIVRFILGPGDSLSSLEFIESAV